MRSALPILALVTLATATPLPSGATLKTGFNEIANAVLQRRATGTTATELEDGPCRAVTFIYARGSTEPGNLGDSGGPQVCDGLKANYGNTTVACQGVGGPYTAGLLDNLYPAGTSPAAITEGVRLFNLAQSKCPSSKVVAGGYSQGAAVIHGAAKQLSTAVQHQVVGLITFGDTRNEQDGGMIPPFPASKVKIFCNSGDEVCDGTLETSAAHHAYAPDFPLAYDFLISKIGTLN